MKTFAITFLILTSLTQPNIVRAQWQPNGVAVSTALHDQSPGQIVSDGAGGALVVWQDDRSGTNWDIYTQRIGLPGTIQWTPDGVALCTAANSQYFPTFVSDGAGGAISTWFEFRNGPDADIYAQRIDATGAIQWTADGVAVVTGPNGQSGAGTVSDGAGGAIIMWLDVPIGSENADLYAQRINAAGAIQWTPDGVALCTTDSTVLSPSMVSDGAGGAIVTWFEARNAPKFDVYVQRVNALGTVLWTADGVDLCTSASNQSHPVIASAGVGGAIVAWDDDRNGLPDIYAQRVSAFGTTQWTPNGVALCTDAGYQSYPLIAADGTGGAIVTWLDYRSGTSVDVYAQRVKSFGAVQWTQNGVALCTAAGQQYISGIVSDGIGEAVVTWSDFRNGNWDIYAQRVGSSGTVQWLANGIALCDLAGDQQFATIIGDGTGGAIVAWPDRRNGIDLDVYALRVGSNGEVPTAIHETRPTPALIVSSNHPNPFSEETVLDVTLDHPSHVRLDVFDVAGHRVRVMDMGRLGAGAVQLVFDGLDEDAHALPSGVYFFRVHADNEMVARKMVIAK